VTRIAFVLLTVAAASLAACASHDPYCEMPTYCVEACGEAPFIQCYSCPDGAISADECMDGGGE
jgi:hypothetical protein